MNLDAVVLNAACRAVTNARFARLHGLPVGPVPFTIPPDPPLKSRARHGGLKMGRQSPLASVRGSARVVALWLRVPPMPLLYAYAPLPACRPQTEAGSDTADDAIARQLPISSTLRVPQPVPAVNKSAATASPTSFSIASRIGRAPSRG
jgi:hypothetical protein